MNADTYAEAREEESAQTSLATSSPQAQNKNGGGGNGVPIAQRKSESARVADSDLESALEQLTTPGISDKVREMAAALLSNLALDSDNVEEILRKGGVASLISAYSMGSAKTKEAVMRALGRLGNNEKNIEEIMRAGGVSPMTGALRDPNVNEEILSAASGGLLSIGTTKERMEEIMVHGGGAKALVAALEAHPEYASLAENGLKIIDKMCSLGCDVDDLIALGGVKAIVAAMLANPSSKDASCTAFRRSSTSWTHLRTARRNSSAILASRPSWGPSRRRATTQKSSRRVLGCSTRCCPKIQNLLPR